MTIVITGEGIKSSEYMAGTGTVIPPSARMCPGKNVKIDPIIAIVVNGSRHVGIFPVPGILMTEGAMIDLVTQFAGR